MGYLDPLKKHKTEVTTTHTALHTVYWGLGALTGEGVGHVLLYGSLCVLTIIVHILNEEPI